MNNFLRYLRRSLAAIAGGVSLLLFIDILGVLPTELHGFFHIQLVPAIMAGSVGIIIFVLLLTLLLGRVYCSVICPLGIVQDFIFRLKKWYARIVQKRKNLKLKYQKPLKIVRYSVFSVAAVPFALGISYPLMLLDPYSNFGRIASSLLAPIVAWVNNRAAAIMNSMGNYSIYNISDIGTPWYVTLFSAVVLIALVVMVWLRGRLWCNTLCPVGTLLGIVSRYSLMRVSTDRDECNRCGACGSNCKAHCIDIQAKTVDASRCVNCFNCLNQCKRGGIKYAATGWKRDKTTSQSSEQPQEHNTIEDTSRRNFLKVTAVAVAALPATIVLGKAVSSSDRDNGEYIPTRTRTKLPMPPGAINRDRFVRKCTGCQLCVSRCPTHVLRPALMENGLEGMMQPYMNFKVECFCNYECKVCSDVCPNGAIVPMSLEQKKLTRVGYAHFKRGKCVVVSDNQDCGACAEHCPSQAVHMIPYRNGLTIPQINPDLCIGCGGCESICPVVPQAIFVQGIDTQNLANEPTQDKIDVNEITDFGF